MSGKVDAITAIDNAIHSTPSSSGEIRRDLRSARAAFADLIEAVQQKLADAEQGYFDDWFESDSPSGDHEEVQRKWLESSDYKDFYVEWSEQIIAISRVRGDQ